MEGKDPTPAEMKRLREIGRAMEKLNAEILKMGYDVYLSAHGRANVMKGPTHDDANNCAPMQENIVYSFSLRRWDGGDW